MLVARVDYSFSFYNWEYPAVYRTPCPVQETSVGYWTIDLRNLSNNLFLEFDALSFHHSGLKGVTPDCKQTDTRIRIAFPYESGEGG